MKQFIKVGIYFLLFIGLGLFIWTIIPKGRVKEVFTINPNFTLFSEKLECSQIQGLMESKYIVNYSKAIRFKESGEVLVTVEKSNLNTANNYKADSFGSCTISLEVWVDGKGMLFEPGNKSVESFTDNQTQMFMFEITPLSAQLEKGTLWIYAVVSKKNYILLERIPLFAIPFSIRVESLFGIPPKIIKIFSLTLTLLVALLLYLQMDLNKNRK